MESSVPIPLAQIISSYGGKFIDSPKGEFILTWTLFDVCIVSYGIESIQLLTSSTVHGMTEVESQSVNLWFSLKVVLKEYKDFLVLMCLIIKFKLSIDKLQVTFFVFSHFLAFLTIPRVEEHKEDILNPIANILQFSWLTDKQYIS